MFRAFLILIFLTAPAFAGSPTPFTRNYEWEPRGPGLHYDPEYGERIRVRQREEARQAEATRQLLDFLHRLFGKAAADAGRTR